jgi:hypothetical protein
MADDQNAEPRTDAQEDESILIVRVFGNEFNSAIIIEENRLRLLKRHAMLLPTWEHAKA